MAALTKAQQELADRRYAEKLAARAEGRAPVQITAPALPTGVSQADIDARYQAKLANHGKPSPEGEAKPEKPKGGKAKDAAPQDGKPAPEGEAKPKA